jgi:SAM-dependent methyltransferase
MSDDYQRFYELAGRLYPEDELTYSGLSGLVRKKWVQAKIRELPPGNLLDCGCNTGRLVADWPKGKVFGVDIAFGALRRGRRMFPRVNFIHADLRRFGFIRDDSIDNAIVIEVLEHIDDPRGFITGLRAALKPGGRVLITTPGYTRFRPTLIPLGVLKSYGIKTGTAGDLYFHTAYKPEELAALVTECGLTVLEKGGFEHELRGWVKPQVLAANAFNKISGKYFPGSKFGILFNRAMRRLEINIFQILDTFGFTRLLKALFPEGRRSYVLARK